MVNKPNQITITIDVNGSQLSRFYHSYDSGEEIDWQGVVEDMVATLVKADGSIFDISDQSTSL